MLDKFNKKITQIKDIEKQKGWALSDEATMAFLGILKLIISLHKYSKLWKNPHILKHENTLASSMNSFPRFTATKFNWLS